MAEITGLPAGETPADKGALLYRGVHPEDREKTRKYMEASMRAEGRFETEYRRIREDDGRIVWVRSSGVLVSDENGRPVRVCGGRWRRSPASMEEPTVRVARPHTHS